MPDIQFVLCFEKEHFTFLTNKQRIKQSIVLTFENKHFPNTNNSVIMLHRVLTGS